jgi:ribonuclease HI
MISIYTDGSCLSNPNGPGGWAFALIEEDGSEYYFADKNHSTTNNRMELNAIIEALSSIKENEKCKIFSDSQVTINCALRKWKRKSNLDLWNEYEKVSKNKNIIFEWVKAHNGDKYNEIVDELAYNQAKEAKEK